MYKSVQSRSFVFVVLLIGGVFSGLGCQVIKRIFTKPPPEGVVQESYTVRAMTYEQTSTIKATLEEILDFMADPSVKLYRGTGIDLEKKVLGNGFPSIGDVFPFDVDKAGIKLKGKIIAVKSEGNKIWFFWDSPSIFMTARMEFNRAKEGIKFFIKLSVEIPTEGKLAPFETMIKIVTKYVFGGIDLMVARLQAHFDPSLDADELVAAGPRGEIFEEFLQVHETQVWIDASPEEIDAWMREPENLSLFTPGLKIETQYLSQWQQAPTGIVVYVPAIFNAGLLKLKPDLFFVKNETGNESVIRIIAVAFGRFALCDVELKPYKGGTLTNFKLVHEIPAFASIERMDLMLFLTQFPQFMQETVLRIKKGVEERNE